MPIPPEKIAQLKTAHPEWELHLLGNEFAEVVVRTPTTEEYQRMLDELADPALKTRAERTILLSCVVYPTEEEFAGIVQRRPGIVRPFANEVAELAGAKAVTTRKKL